MPRAVRSPPEGADPKVFKALADPTRRAILRELGDEERAVHDLAAAFPISRPAVSKHLKVLVEAGLVASRRSGRERLYRIVPGPLREAAAQVRALDALLERGMQGLGETLARQRERPRRTGQDVP